MKLKENYYKPLYKQLKEIIVKYIATGKFNPGDGIPSENELVEKYEVSRVTVRKALSELCDEGVLIRIHGKGTFVLSNPPTRPLKDVMSFSTICKMQNMEPAAKVLRLERVPAKENEVSFFNLSMGSDVILLKRLRLVNNIPVLMEMNYFQASMDFLYNENLEGSVYECIKKHNFIPTKSSASIELYIAGEEESELLDVPINTPLLLSTSKVYDAIGMPLHTSRQIVRIDKDTVFKYYV